ncbi:MAG: threonine ammonia-lyase [Gemmatimonadaceae bacterium]
MTHDQSASERPPRPLVTIDEIKAAAKVLQGVAVRTPLLRDDIVSDRAGVPVWLKPEVLQRSGTFKFRGAYTFLSRLAPSARARGVIAPSSGNHAQGVAMAARVLGVPATVVMPETATQAKRSGAERLGAKVILHGTTSHERTELAHKIAERDGLTIVHPYNDDAVIAGQGTVGIEIHEDLPDVESVLVQVGGGGLLAGIAVAIKALSPATRVIGIEPERTPKLSRARDAGKPVLLEHQQGLADGLLVAEIGDIPFDHHQAYVDEVVTVGDADIARAMRHLLDRAKLVVEPSGAITVAALMTGAVRPKGPTVAVLSGGNIEWEGLEKVFGD